MKQPKEDQQKIVTVLPAQGWKCFEFYHYTGDKIEGDKEGYDVEEIPLLGFAVTTEYFNGGNRIEVIPLLWDDELEIGQTLSQMCGGTGSIRHKFLPPSQELTQEMKDKYFEELKRARVEKKS